MGRGDQKEELENLRRQHELLKKMLEQQEQLRALQGRQAALLAMQQGAEQALAVLDDTGEREGDSKVHTHRGVHISYPLQSVDIVYLTTRRPNPLCL